MNKIVAHSLSAVKEEILEGATLCIFQPIDISRHIDAVAMKELLAEHVILAALP